MSAFSSSEPASDHHHVSQHDKGTLNALFGLGPTNPNPKLVQGSPGAGMPPEKLPLQQKRSPIKGLPAPQQ